MTLLRTNNTIAIRQTAYLLSKTSELVTILLSWYENQSLTSDDYNSLKVLEIQCF